MTNWLRYHCAAYRMKNDSILIHGWTDVAAVSRIGFQRRRWVPLTFQDKLHMIYHHDAYGKKDGPNRINGWGDVVLVSWFGLSRQQLCTLTVFSISHDNLLKISLCCVYGKKKGPNEINGWRDVAHISWFGIFRRRVSTLAVFFSSQFIMRTCLRHHYAARAERRLAQTGLTGGVMWILWVGLVCWGDGGVPSMFSYFHNF